MTITLDVALMHWSDNNQAAQGALQAGDTEKAQVYAQLASAAATVAAALKS